MAGQIPGLNPLKQVKSFGRMGIRSHSGSSASLNPLKQVKSFGLDLEEIADELDDKS